MSNIKHPLAFLRLVERSPAVKDDWKKVSDVLLPMVKEHAKFYPELVQLENDHVRLTDEGRVVLKWAEGSDHLRELTKKFAH
jgi:hypothetical protein